MSQYRHVRPVLSMREPTTASHMGPVYVLFPSDTDPTPDHALGSRRLVQVVVPTEVAAAAPVPERPPARPTLPRVPVGSVVPVAPLPRAPDSAEAEEDEPEREEVEAQPVGSTVIVETSADRKRWLPVHEPIELDSLPLLTEEVVLGPYVRARTLAEGEHQVDVHPLGSASHRLDLA